jgi:hypothetical protein
VKGKLPACGLCSKERRTFKLAVSGSWGAVVLLFIVAVSTSMIAVLILSLVGALAALVLSFSADSFRVRGVVSNDQMWVELHKSSETFSRLIRQALPT